MGEQVWDAYLTDSDKEYLGALPEKRVGFGNSPALLLIDLYRGAFGDKREPLLKAIDSWPRSCGLAAWNALPPMQTALHMARGTGVSIVHMTGANSPVGVGPWAPARPAEESARFEASDESDREMRKWDIVKQLAPLPGESVFRKSSPSSFCGTPLANHLNALAVDTVIVVGQTTSGCVRASVVDGCSHGYRMIVVEEGVFDRHQASHAMSLFDMDQKYADVLSLGEVIEWMAGWKAESAMEIPAIEAS